MNQATAPQRALEPATLEQLIAAHTAELHAARTDMNALRRELEAARSFPGRQVTDTALIIYASRLADFEKVELGLDKDIRDLGEDIRDAATVRSMREMRQERRAALAPAPVPAPARRRRPARPAGQHRGLSAVRGVVPVAAFGAMLRSSWAAAHPVAAGAIATTALTTLAVSSAAIHSAVTPDTSPYAAASSPNPPASVVAAAPLLQPVASSRPAIDTALTKPRPKTDADASSPLTTLLPPLAVPAPDVSAPDVSPVQGPGDTQDPSSQAPPSQQQQPAPAPGALSVSATALDLTGSGTGTITLSCAGGPCSWRVRDGGAVRADVRKGSLQDGESAVITLTVDPAALPLGGSGVIEVRPGGVLVTVSWAAPVVPTAAPSVLPTDTPSAASVLPTDLPSLPVPVPTPTGT